MLHLGRKWKMQMKFEVKYGWNVKSVMLIMLTMLWVLNWLAVISDINWFTPIVIFITILFMLATGKRVIVTERYIMYISPLLIKRRYLIKNIEKIVIESEYNDSYETDKVIVFHKQRGRLFTLSMMYKKIGKFIRHCQASGVEVIDKRFNLLDI